MHHTRCRTAHMVLFTLLVVGASIVQAQSRVFVSGSGNDANPCSIAAPCRTFQRAHNAVAAGGEIVPLDSAGYGTLVITKSVSITAPDGLYAGVTATSSLHTYAIHINGAGANVYLRGLTIIGEGVPIGGVVLESGTRLQVDRCRIKGFDAGVYVVGGPAVEGIIQDSVLDSNDYGIYVDNTAQVALIRCTVTSGTNGIRVVGPGSGTGKPKVTIQETVVRRAYSGLFVSKGECLVTKSTFAACQTGIELWSASFARVVGTTITGNETGLTALLGGTIASGGDNILAGNTTDGSFSSTFSLQ